MTKLLLFLITLFLLSCQSATQTDKEKELLQKDDNQLKKNQPEDTLPPATDDSNKEPQSRTQTTVNWVGTWSFEGEMVNHTLTIGEKYRGANVCQYEATGVQTFYKLECRGVDKGNSFELYYWATNDGAFYQEDRINRDKPILTLKLVNGKILTYWNQLIGGKDGEAGFKKN